MTIDDDEDDDDPSPFANTRENHGGQEAGNEAVSRGRGEREEQESCGVQDTGWGQRGIRALAAASVGSKDSIRSMTSAMLGPDHIYRRKSPAAEPPTYPGRAGPGPRGAATAVAHLRLRTDQARQGKGEQREDEARARG